jgi:hypothetical protein
MDTLKKEIEGFQIKFVVVSEKDKKAQTMVDWLNRYIINNDNENK